METALRNGNATALKGAFFGVPATTLPLCDGDLLPHTSRAATPRPLATAEELAGHLSVPLGTVYAWRYRSQGPKAIKVGRHLRYRWAEVEAWLDSQTT